MKIGIRIKAIRLAEGLSRLEFSQLTDISLDSLKSYENGRRSVNEINAMKITNHPRLKKYTFWLMTGETLPESGQISPDLSVLEQCGVESVSSDVTKRA